ncbi:MULTISPECIES: serine hydrolase domain-containing protein [Streptomyces]|uniref:Beta-lactamase n=1 Tax=Streptomyces griseus subsp. griseus (strain JCM 4626 / CBS 651.72 / NBRC 13350 / KCC S-0626 / ISP 5235) TaxID=455632 RepID=B1VNN4_STRGG|nr:serine hydrolase domain-containing protein [Streptomyces griseus]MBW3702689.1 serine hydrolase [Streptomyces griseus]BAG17057.1 putative beta-lactamase [Streptomyces griseus subsp. griseus NBRC 13350]SED82041.1 CubicO group peptidase, beta-lactamase class C family [Streptomyces griseus]SQA26794.1 beta-lactamase [Streptomyces griseus]
MGPEDIDTIAEKTGFSGVVRIDRGGRVEFAKAYGLAHRAYRVPNTVDTRFGMASGSKGFTALAVLSLIEDGALKLDTTARSLLGRDLPQIADDVTVEHLLTHTSGIGDYLDEEADTEIIDYVIGAAHELTSTEAFLPLVDGHATKFAAGERFGYCNGGFVVLALLAERAGGTGYHHLVRQRVLLPAGMTSTEFLRSDELPADAAVGYLPLDGVDRSNVFHLPVLASGDGGIHTTAEDVSAFWRALFAGDIVDRVDEVVRPRRDVPEESMRYGLGFWLHESTDTVFLIGYDAGVSFKSAHDPRTGTTRTVISNTTPGAWPIAGALMT